MIIGLISMFIGLLMMLYMLIFWICQMYKYGLAFFANAERGLSLPSFFIGVCYVFAGICICVTPDKKSDAQITQSDNIEFVLKTTEETINE